MTLLEIDRCMYLGFGSFSDSAETEEFETDEVITVDAMI
jgi:hypothetical protein